MARIERPMTRELAIEELKALQTGSDFEAEHSAADDVLCALLTALGYGDVVSEWERVNKWYA